MEVSVVFLSVREPIVHSVLYLTVLRIQNIFILPAKKKMMGEDMKTSFCI